MNTPEEFFKHYSSLYQFEEGSPEFLIDKEDFKKAMTEFAGLETRALRAELAVARHELMVARQELTDRPALQAAIEHVKKYHPTLSIVIFDIDGRWQYMDAEFNSFVFGKEIDTSILEEAGDSIEFLPFIYQIREK